MSLLSWLLRKWEPRRSARCTACGKRACGILTEDDEIACERCGKRWNYFPDDRELTEEFRLSAERVDGRE